ncbi:serine hydrolase domain-containing protein [Jatrophihabitans sp. DSM 45814]
MCPQVADVRSAAEKPPTSGFVAPGFEPVRTAFEGVVAEQVGTGAALAIWRDGSWLVDVWGGYADQARTSSWQRDSIVQAYSVCKPFAALCALLLVDRGTLELDAPVQLYWPEFGARTTIRHLLSHQAGIVVLDSAQPTEVLYNWSALCDLLAAQPPIWVPGSAHGESALFYGHLVGEVVRRIDGRLPGQFLAEEVCRPLSLDFQFGLSPADQLRAVDLTNFNEYNADLADDDRKTSLYWQAVNNPPGARDPKVVNSAVWRSAQIPAVNGHGTARAMAGLYAQLLDGGILSTGLIAEATAPQSVGVDRVFNQPNAWGLGFAVDEDGFGMAGLGGSYAGASRRGRYAIAFVTATMGDHRRVDRLENVFRAVIGLPDLD